MKRNFVAKHSKASEAEKKTLFEVYNVSIRELPKILLKDPAIEKLSPKSGDVIKIERESKSAGRAVYYRVAIEG